MRTLRVLLSPRMLALHAAGIVVVTATILLGLWQYGAWSHHRVESAEKLAEAEPRPIADVLGTGTAFPNSATGAPVSLQGTWLSADTLYVSGHQQDGQDGYWVVTPLSCDRPGVQCGGPATLVVLGFTTDIPVAAPTGAASVTGWLQPSDPHFVADDDPTDDVLPALRIPSVAQVVDVPLSTGYVVAKTITPPASTALSPVAPETLPKPPATTALRNLFYGLQWWVFGVFAVFMWWRWSLDAIEADRSGGADQEPSDPAVPSGA